MSTAAQTVKRWEHCPSCDSSTGIRELGCQWVCLECSHRFNKPVEKVSAEDYTALERRVPTWQPIETHDGRQEEVILYFPPDVRNHLGPWRRIDVYPVSCTRQPTHWMPLPAPPDAGGL